MDENTLKKLFEQSPSYWSAIILKFGQIDEKMFEKLTQEISDGDIKNIYENIINNQNKNYANDRIQKIYLFNKKYFELLIDDNINYFKNNLLPNSIIKDIVQYLKDKNDTKRLETIRQYIRQHYYEQDASHKMPFYNNILDMIEGQTEVVKL